MLFLRCYKLVCFIRINIISIIKFAKNLHEFIKHTYKQIIKVSASNPTQEYSSTRKKYEQKTVTTQSTKSMHANGAKKVYPHQKIVM